MDMDFRDSTRGIGINLHMPPLVCGSVAYKPLRKAQPRAGNPELPLVSIITVTFNAEASIETALRSVAAQSYAGPIEYIVIDGASRDRTLEIIRRNLSHVDCLISEPDKGIYDAMNKGLLRARGKYVALLNADDLLFPDFIAASVAKLENSGADISFCDYETEDSTVGVEMPNMGILLSQLGIKHNTFLIHRRCFERLGGFDTSMRIVADAKWNRAAFAAGLRFEKIDGTHVFYSTRGLSAASTPKLREEIIAESTRLILQAFDVLDEAQARTLYLSNFNPIEAAKLIALHKRFGHAAPDLAQAIVEAVRWNLRHRPGYQLRPDDVERLSQLLSLAQFVGMAREDLQYDDPESLFASMLQDLFAALTKIQHRIAKGGGVTLHFARKFSTPSETFIYDFVKDIAASRADEIHVMLCDERINAAGRPYEMTLCLPWDTLPKGMALRLYGLIWEVLCPVRIVAHFALNGWWLHSRLTPEQRAHPWVNMCHGIDVFCIGENPDYTSYIQNYCALAPRVVFTAVSRFLRDQLVEKGVPDSKIFSVPNAVSPHFLKHCKADGFWRQDRPLRLLSTGRLIKWKGHDVLLRALADLRRRTKYQVELTIVYGRSDAELPALLQLIETLELKDCVTLRDFVDFRAEPGFLPGFDLFVLPSTTSQDATPRTETFGVAVLEAMVSGLPVIGTDAGGIPEVIGDNGPKAVIVPHGNSAALADAILAMMENSVTVFSPARALAEERAQTFSAATRIENFTKALAALDQPRRRILHFCALGGGGAAGASINIHKGFLRRGYDSVFVTRNTELARLPKDLPNVVALEPELSIDFNHCEPQRRPGFTTFTLDDHIISNQTLANLVAGADLINLTWSAKFLSVENIAMLTRLGIPVVSTLRDMHSLAGGCHFFHGCDHWQSGCANCPQLPLEPETGFAQKVLQAKQTAWNHAAMTYVALSDHSLNTLSKAALTKDIRREKLPNFVETDVFYPDDTPFMEGVDLAPDVIRIGYLPSFNSRIKGHAELLDALSLVKARHPEARYELVVAADTPLSQALVPFPVRQVPAIQDRNLLRQFYNMVDMVAVPSLEETFSNTCVEALACGTPVVGFKTGVLEELLANSILGAAVALKDVEGLAEVIHAVGQRPYDRGVIAGLIREAFNEQARMDAYEALFTELMGARYAQPPLSEEGRDALAGIATVRQDFKLRFVQDRLGYWRREQRRLQADVARAQEELREVYTSRSWALTRPYRFMGRLLRRL